MSQKKYNFLVVEDELPVLRILTDILKLSPYVNAIFTAEDGEKAFNLYKSNKVDVVITDILMPKFTGLELLKKIKESNQDANIIVISAYGNIENLKEAIRNGAYDYIMKPFTVDEILFSVNRVIEKLKLLEERKNYINSLEKAIKDTKSELENSFYDSLKVILNTIEVRDRWTLVHSQNVSVYAEKLAKKLGFARKELEKITIGAILHDIGKIGIPDIILLKPSKLTESEVEIMKQHPLIGQKILAPMIKDNSEVIEIITYHHERFDGSGYPCGLKGKNIPISARIVSVVEAFEVMSGGTIYSKPKTPDIIKMELINNSGKQFDPEIVNVFLSILEK
ncbi:MAG: HD domain-containing phosphohydrolase [Brevinematia bacterium]